MSPYVGNKPSLLYRLRASSDVVTNKDFCEKDVRFVLSTVELELEIEA